jgi:hypothetical protein
MHDEPLRSNAADQASRLTSADYTAPSGPARGGRAPPRRIGGFID